MALAIFSNPISKLPENDFIVKMNTLITNTHLRCSIPLDEMQVTATLPELCKDLRNSKPAATFEEIELAFKNGYKGEYGDFYGLNNRTYFFWIGAFYFGQNRARIKKLILESKAEIPIAKKDEAEVEIIMKDACLRSFDDYCKGAVIRDFGNVKYEFLVKHEILNFPKERKDAIYELAKQQARQTAIDERQKAETIEKALSKLSPDTIISESKRMALLEFFKDLKESEMELSDMF